MALSVIPGHAALSWHEDGARPGGRTRGGRRGSTDSGPAAARPGQGGGDLPRGEPQAWSPWICPSPPGGRTLASTMDSTRGPASSREEAARGWAGCAATLGLVQARRRWAAASCRCPHSILVTGRSDLGPRASLQAKGGRWGLTPAPGPEWQCVCKDKGRRGPPARGTVVRGSLGARVASACRRHLLLTGPPRRPGRHRGSQRMGRRGQTRPPPPALAPPRRWPGANTWPALSRCRERLEELVWGCRVGTAPGRAQGAYPPSRHSLLPSPPQPSGGAAPRTGLRGRLAWREDSLP